MPKYRLLAIDIDGTLRQQRQRVDRGHARRRVAGQPGRHRDRAGHRSPLQPGAAAGRAAGVERAVGHRQRRADQTGSRSRHALSGPVQAGRTGEVLASRWRGRLRGCAVCRHVRPGLRLLLRPASRRNQPSWPSFSNAMRAASGCGPTSDRAGRRRASLPASRWAPASRCSSWPRSSSGRCPGNCTFTCCAARATRATCARSRRRA